MTTLLDEWVPVIEGAPLPEDPLHPITPQGRQIIEEQGDEAPVGWLHRDDRYVEKLATPDVSVADLIGDIDPIKAANEGLDYSDHRALHFGLIPRSHRCIFAINELPDLQPRIQVALFNILQEGDIQIRGFQMRLALDIQFVFTANPEDYTNRGAIITPLKDRIQSQILTHYPTSMEDAMAITDQEADVAPEQRQRVTVPGVVRRVLERIAFEARESEHIDERSGVSARLPISALEHLVAAGELRILRNGTEHTQARLTDLLAVIPAVNGKVELVYEGEQEGAAGVALSLIPQGHPPGVPRCISRSGVHQKGQSGGPVPAHRGMVQSPRSRLAQGPDGPSVPAGTGGRRRVEGRGRQILPKRSQRRASRSHGVRAARTGRI